MISQLIFDFDDKELGYYFYQQRERKHLFIKDVAAKCGVSYSYICKFENGKCKILDANKIMKLAKCLELDLKFCLLK